MVYNVYAIQDAAVGFMTPTVDVNDRTAVRNFVHAMKNVNSIMNSHPQDFALYRIGEYDSELGVISGSEITKICDGSSVKE